MMPCLKIKSPAEMQAQYLVGDIQACAECERRLFQLSALCACTKRGSVQTNNQDTGQYKEELCIQDEQSHLNEAKIFSPKTDVPYVLKQQTYRQWKADQDMQFGIRRARKRRTICVQPLEDFPDFINNFTWSKEDGTHGFFSMLRHYLKIFFMGFEVELMPTKRIPEYDWTVKTRYHSVTKEKQLLVSDIYKNMRHVLPPYAYAMLGITWTDLYPTEELNFVLGEAAQVCRAAVFCFGRFEPKAYVNGVPPPAIEDINGDLIWRMLKVITHETCHLFGLRHCVFFDCAMNESNSLKEALSQPMFLCPVCIRKIHKCARFNVIERYTAMLHFFKEISTMYPSQYFDDALVWLEHCLDYLNFEMNTKL